MQPKSKTSTTNSTYFFKTIETHSKSFSKGRTGYLINKKGDRIPFKVIYCSFTGKGAITMPDTYNNKMRA